MRIELRGTIRAAAGTDAIDLEVPAGGLPLSQVLARLADKAPRAGRLLDEPGHHNSVRVVLNATLVNRGDDPLVQPADTLLLLVAMAGG